MKTDTAFYAYYKKGFLVGAGTKSECVLEKVKTGGGVIYHVEISPQTQPYRWPMKEEDIATRNRNRKKI